MKSKKSNLTSILLFLILTISVGLIGLTGCSQSTTNDTTPLPNSTDNTGNKDNPNSDAPKTSDPIEPSETNNPSNAITTEPEPSTTSPILETSEEVFYGQWVIKQVLAYGSAGTYSSEDATSLLDQSVNFSTDEASGFGDQLSDISKVITNPVYKKSTISESDFITNYRMTFDMLGIESDDISEIFVSDSEGNGFILFIKDDNTLIIYGGDTYFELVRKTT